MAAKLTDKQKHFCDVYLANGMNATKAVIAAGYSECKPIGYYVYMLIDPRNDTVFYVGKGKGNRAWQHSAEYRNNRVNNALKHRVIGEIHNLGMEHTVRVVASDLVEGEALDIERYLIGRLKDAGITNISMVGVDAKEKQKAEAQTMLSKMLPYDLWVALKNPPEWAKEYYHKTVAELKKISQEGYISEIIVKANGEVIMR